MVPRSSLPALALLFLLVPVRSQTEELEHFERVVRPILSQHCQTCHGPERQKGGLRLDHREFLLHGSETGPVVTPGDLDRSRLITAIRYSHAELRMPPKGRLDDDAIAAMERWVRAGVPWPEEPIPTVAAGPPQFDLAARRGRHWAWQPLSDPPVPEIPHAALARDTIDHFLLDRLAREGLTAAPEVDRRTWYRRVSYALTGLPPSIDALNDYLADSSTNADERAVDRLLATTAYAEHWTRHWLDLVRYAETYGHEFDYEIPFPWKYRDYVIRAFETDVPFDDFVREHLAGDLIEPPRLHPREQTNESILATGFWFFGQATHGPVDVRQDSLDRIDNQIDVVSKTFLGLTVACARCHDHKFDAIAAEDYYALAGYLRSSHRQIAFLDPHRRIQEAVADLERISNPVRRAARALVANRLPGVAAGLTAAMDLANLVPATPTVIEAETLRTVGHPNGEYGQQPLDGRWSDSSHRWWRGGKVGDTLELEFVAPVAGPYRLVFHLTKARDYGIVQLQLDGEKLGEPFDGFDPQLAPSGALVRGPLELSAGPHRLTVRILGHHPRAVPSLMFGLDRLELHATNDESVDRESTLHRVASAHGLDSKTLSAWFDLLLDPATSEVDHPFHWWRETLVAPPESRTTRLAEAIADAQRERTSEVSSVLEDFEDGAYEGFEGTGWAFLDGPTRPGDLHMVDSGLEILPSGVADSGRLGNGLQGILRSQSFVIPKDGLSYRLAARSATIRVVIEDYVMDTFNALLFQGLTIPMDTGGVWRWFHHQGDLTRYAGSRAHLEFLDEGPGFLSVDEVRFGPPPSEDSSALARAAFATEPPDLESAAKAFEQALEAQRRAVARSEVSADWASVLTLAYRYGLVDRFPDDALVAWRAAAAALPAPERALAIIDGTAEDEFLLVRGDPRHPSRRVPRRFLTACGGTSAETPPTGSGRLELAEQILSPEVPLPARVFVNRAWHHVFGSGLVPTPDDFGVLGRPPSHPELLDHLATWFRNEADWSTKRLLRRLVLTSAFRRSSRLDDRHAEERDPGNVWLHRMSPRRLTGEMLRDALLVVSGRLDPKPYGPPVPVHLTPFLDGRGRPARSGPVDGEGRRTLYLAVRRNFLDPFLSAFDQPTPATTAGRRLVSNVPAQALALMNSELVELTSGQFAQRWLDLESDDAARVARMFLEAYGREPTAVEAATAARFLADAHGSRRRTAWSDFAHALVTAKAFYFIP